MLQIVRVLLKSWCGMMSFVFKSLERFVFLSSSNFPNPCTKLSVYVRNFQRVTKVLAMIKVHFKSAGPLNVPIVVKVLGWPFQISL